MTDSEENRRKNPSKLQEKRIIPGGYYCLQKLDEIAMCNAAIIRDLDSITGVNTSREEIYRLVARIYHQVHQSDEALTELKLIYK